MPQFIKKIKAFTSSIEPWWTFVLVPIWQEFLFRYLPWRFLYLSYGKFWEIGLSVSLVFALIHWEFGKWFMVYSFIWGIILWWVMVHFGLLPAILIHALVNVADLRFGIRKFLRKLK